MKTVYFLLILLSCTVYGRGELFPFTADTARIADSTHIRLDRLSNWQGDKQIPGARPPFAALGYDTLRFSATFKLKARQTDNYIFYTGGFPGSAAIFINGRRIVKTRMPWIPVEKPIDSGILKTGSNTVTLVLTSRSEIFPVFTHLYTSPPFIALFQPFGIKRRPAPLIDRFSYTVTEIKKKARIVFSYTIENKLKKKAGYAVEETVTDDKGTLLYRRRKNLQAGTGKYRMELKLDTSRMWTAANPRFVTVTLGIKRYQQLIEKRSYRTGIRYARFLNGRFFVNGRRERIIGLNFYFNPREMSGKSITAYYRKQLTTLKQAGFNAVRFPGYMPPETVLNTADTLGLMIFAELPLRRYSPHVLQNEQLLNATRSAIQSVLTMLGRHPSLFALGMGNEMETQNPVIQRFYIISSEVEQRPAPLLTYLSPAGAVKSAGLPVDFYMYLKYALQDTVRLQPRLIAFLPGNVGQTIIRNRDEMPEDFIIRKTAWLKSWLAEHGQLSGNGYFIDAYNDQPVRFALSRPSAEQPFGLNAAGLFPDGRPVFKALSPDTGQALLTPASKKPDNFFALVLFFWTLVFLFFYRRYPRFRDNFSRALRHSYGFYVDMRERRIIPVFNTLMIGLNTVMVLSVLLASTVYYYSGNHFFREMLAILFPDKELYYLLLSYSSHPWLILLIFMPLIFIHPLITGIFIKVYALLRRRYVRFRQTIAIGMWAGAPFAFFMPLSLVSYHIHYYQQYTGLLWLIALFFILWTHYRLINGIRVLMVVPFGVVFLILFLSYIIPLVIFFAFFNPQPLWFEQLQSLINSRMLF